MIEIDKTIVSLDVIHKKFTCNLEACKGACCVEGDSGAPLTEEEAVILEEIHQHIYPYLSEEHIHELEIQGSSVIDVDGDRVTPLVNNLQCAYTYVENGVTKCAIEKAYFDGIVQFRKPVSCHLFPIRITEYSRFTAVNYQQLDICKPGRKYGNETGLPLWVFLKEPLIRQFGIDWYNTLSADTENIK